MRDSQLATFLPSDKVVLVRENISAIKLPRCRPIKIWTRRGIGRVHIYMYLTYHFSRVTTEISRAGCHLRAAVYISVRECVVARLQRAYLCVWYQGAARREGKEGKWGYATHNSLIYVHYWRITQTAGTTLATVLTVTSCNLVLTSYFRSESTCRRQLHARTCVRACVHECGRACVSSESHEKSSSVFT